jgi:hypothetical protein
MPLEMSAGLWMWKGSRFATSLDQLNWRRLRCFIALQSLSNINKKARTFFK